MKRWMGGLVVVERAHQEVKGILALRQQREGDITYRFQHKFQKSSQNTPEDLSKGRKI